MSLIEQLAERLDRSNIEVSQFLLNAPKKYKVYTIPKRTSGYRTIAQPSKELKEFQRAYIELQELPVHSAAMAYREGIGIKQNALAHKNNPYLLKLDFENFFNSISSDLFWNVWKSIQSLPPYDDQQVLEKLLFWNPSKTSGSRLVLSIGAPSSPLVSNFFMYKFDCAISELCIKNGVVYTRYADDVTFSTVEKGRLFELPKLVEKLLIECFGSSIKVNRKKTKFSSKAHNRHVTGVTLNNDGKLSLGRKRKRYIKHLVHQVQIGCLREEDRLHLKGLLAFAKHIEPKFLEALNKKYSVELITQIIGKSNG